jgi:hypothetical protein
MLPLSSSSPTWLFPTIISKSREVGKAVFPFNDFIRFSIVKQNGHPISGRQESNREFSAAFLASKYGPRIFGKTWCVVSANRIIRLKSRFSSRPGMSSYTCFFLYKDFLKLIV